MRKIIPGYFVLTFFITLTLVTACAGFPPSVTPTSTQFPTATSRPTQTALPCPSGSLVTTIPEVQGAGHRSPLEGKANLCLSGIVTAIKGNGFYMQDVAGDNNDHTSDGIFVEARSAFQVKKGDLVLVWNADVKEFNPAGVSENSLTITNLRPGSLQVLSSGNPTPAPVIIGRGGRDVPNLVIENDVKGYAGRVGDFDPEEDGLDFYESLEGMLVQVNSALAISPTASYKEVVILADEGKDATTLSQRNVLLISESDQNPERIFIDDAFINIPDIYPGARFNQPIIGVIDYSYGNYKLEPTQKLQFTQGRPQVNAIREPAANELSIATYNIENLDALNYPARLVTLARDVIETLHSPDILVLQEVQDNDGEADTKVVEADQTITRVISAIQNQGGPKYQALNIDPLRNADGGAPGGNIRVVVFSRPDKGLQLASAPAGDAIQPVQVINNNNKAALTLNPGRIAPGNSAFLNSRKPLAVQFIYRNESIFVIANHLNSKGEDGPLFGDIQPPPLFSEYQRVSQARVINNFVKQILAIEPDARVVVLGDLNDFPWSKPIKTLCGAQLVNLMENIDVSERYTYIFEGNAQVLDHILASRRLVSEISAITALHINTEYLPSERLSDHDPVLAYFVIEP